MLSNKTKLSMYKVNIFNKLFWKEMYDKADTRQR